MEMTMEKEAKYRLLTEQIRSLVAGETDAVAVMANVCAAIHESMGFFWTGFYRVVGEELVLGPFQGPAACVHIGFGRGVCGTAWQRRETIVVPDVEQFPGHIACSSQSRSEIVVPMFSEEGSVVAVLDIDSKQLATFDDIDRQYLEEIVALVSRQISSTSIIQENMEQTNKQKRTTPEFITELQPNEIFVFGSNLRGMHGGGAAYVAYRKFGAVMGQGVGLQGQSYAIPTMQGGVETIRPYVDEFIAFAKSRKDLTFLVTRIGCGIAGFRDEEIAPLFAAAHEVENIVLPPRW